MATSRRRRIKSDGDSERSFSESDVEADDVNDAESSLKGSPEKLSMKQHIDSRDGLEDKPVSETGTEQEDDVNLKNEQGTVSKVADVSEYESAEEQATDHICEVSPSKDQDSLSELVDEEGGEEGIAEAEDVEGDFLCGDPPEDGEIEESSDDADCVEEERQQGDGEECSPVNAAMEKELDFDEDRRNPQYIPKKGIFYEHDDRNNEDVKEKEEEPPRDRKKKLWLDEGRWGHDRFRLEEQFPKSKVELIETYGYDIRNEDGPPRARRRRRYGRGPTKYERNWEDVSAYSREKFRGSPRGMARGRRDRGGPRGFRGAPRFRGRDRRDYNTEMSNDKEDENEHGEEEQPINTENKDSEVKDDITIINNKEFPALPTKEPIPIPETETIIEQRPFFQKSSSEAPDSKSVRTLTFENSNLSGRNSLERDIPPRRGKTAPFSNHYSDRGSRRPVLRSPRGSGRGEHNRRGRGNMRHISPRFLENKMNHLTTDLENLALQQTVGIVNGVSSNAVQHLENSGIVSTVVNDNELPAMALKGAGDSAGRPKRYSSLRQRSLPESNSYPSTQQAVPTQHAPYYETGYQPALYAPTESVVPTPSTQSQSATSPPLINPSAYQTFAPTPYTDSYGLRLPVTTPPPRLFPQAAVPAGQPILAPPPPPPCIPPAPSILNFAPPPAPSYHQFAYPQYAQPAPPPPPAPPNEIYQPGITYYYPQTQPTSIRLSVQKRPKAAIPILPPPERESKRNEKKETIQPSSISTNDTVNGEVPSLRTESSSQSQPLPSVGVES